jgi:large subunit ribosomal protein L22
LTLISAPVASQSDVKKVLQSALTNAENNHNLNVDRLVVAEASVGKTVDHEAFHARARGKRLPALKSRSSR